MCLPRWIAGPALASVGGWVLMTVLTSACDSSPDLEVRVDTLASGRLVISNPDPAAVAKGRSLELVEEMRIGAALGGDAESPELFSQVLSLAVDEYENTYVGDYQSNEIRVFDREGSYVRTIGGQGEGPGEFSRLAGIVWDRASAVLWAVDIGARRVVAHDASGRVLATHPYGRDTYNAQIPWVGYADLNGFLHYTEPRDFDLLLKRRSSPDGGLVTADSLPIPRIERDTYTASSSLGTEIRTVPMQPLTMFGAGPDGMVWLSTSSEFRLHKVDFSGDTLRTVELRRPARPLSRRERDSVATASGLPARRIPPSRPIIGRQRIGTDGWLWVPVEGESNWEVFDEFGYHLGLAKSPVPLHLPPEIVIGAGTITGVTRDEVGVQYVVRLRLR